MQSLLQCHLRGIMLLELTRGPDLATPEVLCKAGRAIDVQGKV